MTIAIMQPYLLPYLGYFQLIRASEVFVFYDDVNYIKRGWVNRNRILLQGTDHFLTVPCVKPSQNRLIADTKVNYEMNWVPKFQETLKHAYAKSVNYDAVMPLLNQVFENQYDSISELNIAGIVAISNYLELKTNFKTASEQNYGNKQLDRADRLIDISKKEGCKNYVNAIGGMEIYEPAYFAGEGVSLRFLKPNLDAYLQNSSTFIPGLSMIDLMMNLTKEEIFGHLDNYTLVGKQ